MTLSSTRVPWHVPNDIHTNVFSLDVLNAFAQVSLFPWGSDVGITSHINSIIVILYMHSLQIRYICWSIAYLAQYFLLWHSVMEMFLSDSIQPFARVFCSFPSLRILCLCQMCWESNYNVFIKLILNYHYILDVFHWFYRVLSFC